MALYKNTHSIKGFVGKDAESFATKQQRTFVVFSVATKSGYKDKQTGQWVNHTEWHRIVAFGTPSDYAKDLKKGDYVEVEGEVRSTDFDKEVGDGKCARHQDQEAGEARELERGQPRHRADYGGRRGLGRVVLPREVQP